MKILSIDTASNICSVALLENEVCVKELIVNDAKNHSEKIMPLIQQILHETNTILKDIDLIVCDQGPGSFTGIRIGIGTVLAFQDTLNIPSIGISSLEALAYNIKQNGMICALIDAKNNNVYMGLFKHQDNNYYKIDNFSFKTIDEVTILLNKYDSPIIFVGDGALSYKEIIQNKFNNCIFVENNQLSSYSLGIAGYNTYRSGVNNTLVPLYLRKSQAERALEEKNKKE